jgi:hypothetical protein
VNKKYCEVCGALMTGEYEPPMMISGGSVLLSACIEYTCACGNSTYVEVEPMDDQVLSYEDDFFGGES